MNSRRDFIRKSTASIAGLPLAGQLPGWSSKISFEELDLRNSDDWKVVRSLFPLTHNRTFFNNGTIGPSPYVVLDAVRDKMASLNEWGEYAGHEDSRAPVAQLLGVSIEEISLTHNTTEGINIVAAGLHLEPGDEVIMTTHEHAGNALPWLNQARRKKFNIKVFEPAMTGDENLARVKKLVSSRTRVMAIPHITCTTGVVMPIKEIAELGRQSGIRTFFDGAHGPGSLKVDLKEVGCDFYASCGHKWLLGPAGTGFLYVNEGSRNLLDPIFIGAYSDAGWELSAKHQHLKGFVPTAHRFDYGTQSAALSHGLKSAVDLHRQIGLEKIETYSRSLATALVDGLLEFEKYLEVLTPLEGESRATMVGFRLKNVDFREFGKMASKADFRIRLVPESGLNSVRISTHVYNNIDEVKRFHKLVKSAIV